MNSANKTKKAVRKTKRHSMLVATVFACVVLYAAVNLVNLTVQYNNRKHELEMKQREEKENEFIINEYKKTLELGKTDEYVIRVAREKLGLAFRDEKVYKISD